MRAHHAIISVAMVLIFAGGAEARGPANADPNLRPADASASALVADAVNRSAVVRDLAEQLKGTDLVAYVRVGPLSSDGRDSTIHFAARSKYQRFMIIKVNDALPLDRQVALVGHELQHAVDMSKSAWITDHARMQQYFALTGWKLDSPERGFETLSAMTAERKVGRELKAAAPAVAVQNPSPR